MNKTHYSLDARLTKIKPVEEKINTQQNLTIETLKLSPNNVSPSISLHEELKLTLKLRFSSVSEGPWSGPIPLYSVELSNGNKHFWLVKSLYIFLLIYNTKKNKIIILLFNYSSEKRKYKAI